MERYSKKNNFTISIYVTLLLILSILPNFLITAVSATDTTTYICTKENVNTATEGATSTPYDFPEQYDIAEFTDDEYDDISVNDTHYVFDDYTTPTDQKYQYHRFIFLIDEDIEDIVQIDITCLGNGGLDLGGGTSKGHSMWVKQGSTYKKKDSGTGSLNEILSITYTSNFDDIIIDGYLECCHRSDYKSQTLGDASYIKTYYIEVKITYNPPGVNNPPETTLDDISNPAGYNDLITITGSASDTDGTISSVSLTIHNNTDNTGWTTTGWKSFSDFLFPSANDGSFDEKNEDWTYDCESAGVNWADGKQYTITALAYDNNLDFDLTAATDTFIYSNSMDNNAPTAYYLFGADQMQYAGKEYSFTTRHQDDDGASEIKYAYASIGTSPSDISFRCEPNTGSNPSVTITRGSSYISSATTSRTTITNGYDITWVYTIGWNWTHDDKSDIDYYAFTTDLNGANSDWYVSNQNADYENELIVKYVSFFLNDSAYSEDGNTFLTEDEWFRGGTGVKAEGVICYEGADTIYPPDDACDVRLYANNEDSDNVDTSLGGNGEFDTSFYITPSESGIDSDFDFEIRLENIASDLEGSGGGDTYINCGRDNQAPSTPTNVQCRPDGYEDTGETDDDTSIYLTWTNADDGNGSGISTGINGHGIYYAEIGDNTPDEIAYNDGKDTDTGATGALTYFVRACDNVGNYGPSASDTITVEITHPSCIIEYDNSKTTFKEEDELRIYANFTIAESNMDEDSIKIEIETNGDGDLSKTNMNKLSNNIWYYDWIIPSGNDEDGLFSIRVYGQDLDGKNISPNPTVEENKRIDNSIKIYDELIINSPSSIIEGSSFEILVTSNNKPVDSVLIIFNKEAYYTKLDGKTNLIAPHVEKDTIYQIIASKSNYIDNSTDILIQDSIETKKGYLRGIVTDNLSKPIDNALVCFLIDEISNIYKCIYTDENGEFTLHLEIGTYIVSAVKNGFIKEFQVVKITEDNESIIIFILQKEKNIINTQPLIDQELFFNYLVEDTVKDGTAGAIINVKEKKIMILYNNLSSTFEESDSGENIKFRISAPNGTPNKIIFVKITDNTFSSIKNMNNIKVKYDGSEIERLSLEEILDFNKNYESVAYSIFDSLQTENEKTYYLVIRANFSEHLVEIYTTTSKLPEVLGGIIALFYNLIFIALFAVILIGLIIYRIRHF